MPDSRKSKPPKRTVTEKTPEKKRGDPPPRTRKQLLEARLAQNKKPGFKRSMVTNNQLPSSKVSMEDDQGDTGSRRNAIEKAVRSAITGGNRFITKKDKGFPPGRRTDTPPQSYEGGGRMKAKGAAVGGRMKAKGAAVGGRMKAKGAAVGGRMKAKGAAVGGRMKAKGAAVGGRMKAKGAAVGGQMKQPTAGQAGLKELPTGVRNNMGYAKNGGRMKSKGMSKGGRAGGAQVSGTGFKGTF